ncbi:MAG: response regulator transcription factor, partial [Rhizobacter sp.]
MVEPAVRLLLIDDHPLVRDGLRARLASVPGVEVVGEAGSAAEAQQQVLLASPTLVLMDVGMRDMNGIDLVALLLSEHPGLLVLMLSMYDNPEYVQRALQAGARG